MTLILLLAACAAGPRFPGPLRPMARAPSYERVAPEPVPEEPRAPRRDDRLGDAMVEAATYYLDHAPVGFRSDCSGFVCAVTDRAGWPLSGSTRSMWEWAHGLGLTHTRKEPRPGDLAFFDDTYDRDRDGKVNDALTHVAVVLEVGGDGTIVLAHGGTSAGRTELRMNLRHPDVAVGDDGRVLNDPLRVQRRSDPARTRYLAGELWRGFATLSPDTLALEPGSDAWVEDSGS